MRAGRTYAALVLLTCICAGGGSVLADPPLTLDTTLENFFMRGTQPNTLQDLIEPSFACTSCHDMEAHIVEDWTGSMMAQAARDPLFYACLDVANHDAPESGDTCIRCHVPKAWLEGRSSPTDGSAITQDDRDGITCNFCHRLVDPYNKPGAPPVDPPILEALGANLPLQSMDLGNPSMPGDNGSANYVVDPLDQRRGPFPIRPIGGPAMPGDANCELFHSFVVDRDTFESALHRRSDLCSTCHDVSFPHFSRDTAGNFVFNGAGVAHPDGNKYNMVPEQRTYSEWLRSDFPLGVDLQGRFGGPGQNIVSDCQDCHMPVNNERGCNFESVRPDKPRHHFSGAATWVLDAIGGQYGPGGPYDPCQPVFSCAELGDMQMAQLQVNKERNISMLNRAADLSATLSVSPMNGAVELNVRVTNQTGHKLPTGYPEGRRMWITVAYFSANDDVTPIAVDGGYDPVTGILDEATTKVYETRLGPDAALAASLNRPAAPSAHAMLANMRYKDNRIPPRGFTNAAFTAVQAEPIGYTYADGQYWDDTVYIVPPMACSARVTLCYQATTREYIEFLRDNNPDAGNPDNRGQVAYDLWTQHGGSIPVGMVTLDVDVATKGDLNLDGLISLDDVPSFVSVLLGDDTDARHICASDLNHDAHADGLDIQAFAEQLLIP